MKPIDSRVHNKLMIVETQRILKRIVIWSHLHRNMQEFLSEPGKKLRSFLKTMSVDTALGLPFNIASYGLLLTLLSLESDFEPGTLVGFLGDTHVYENHIDGIKEQLERLPKTLPAVKIKNFTSIFDWEYTDTTVCGYQHHQAIKFDIAV